MQNSSQFIVRTHTANGMPNHTPRATIVQMREVNQTERPRYLSQIFATLAVSLGSFATGMGKGYSSPAIASLKDLQKSPIASTMTQSTSTTTHSSSSDFRNFTSIVSSKISNSQAFIVSDQQASWVASLSLLGALFGAIFCGVAMKFGRKNVLLAVAVPFSSSWVLTVFSVNVQMMFVTSFIGGFCGAIILMVSQVYISEISEPGIRGCLSAVLKIFSQVGVLISYTMGAYLDWKQLAMVISVTPIALFFTMLYMPETPSYLVLNGREEEAMKSLQWLKGGSEYEIHKELITIKNNLIKNQQQQNNVRFRRHGNLSDIIDKLSRPIMITCGLMFFQRFSGANSFSFYAVSIFRDTFAGTNPHNGAIIVGFVQLLASLLSGLLIDIIGRLPLLITSSAFMSVALAAFGSFAYFEETSKISSQYDWIPLLCVLVFTIAFSLGISPISWLLVGELFPLEYRGLGSSLAMSFSYGCAFIGVKTFVDFREKLGLYGAYWLYSAFSVAGLGFVVCFVPETRGRDLDEMNHSFLRS